MINHVWSGPMPQAADYKVGESVKIHAMGSFYLGSVVSVSRTRVKVAFVSGTGRARTYAFNPSVTYSGMLRHGRYDGPRAYRLADEPRIIKAQSYDGRCFLCGTACEASEMHLHQDQHIGPCCWDDRLKASE